MKLGKIVSESFTTSYRKLLQQKLPIKTSLKLRKLTAELQKDIDAYTAEYNKLITEYGVEQILEDNTKQIVIADDKKDEFITKINELCNQDCTVSTDLFVQIDELGNEQLTLTVDDLIQLEFIG